MFLIIGFSAEPRLALPDFGNTCSIETKDVVIFLM